MEAWYIIRQCGLMKMNGNYTQHPTFVSKIKMVGCVQAGVASEMHESKNELGGIAEAAINNHSSNGILA